MVQSIQLLPYVTYDFPQASDIKDKLYNEVVTNTIGEAKGGAKRTGWAHFVANRSPEIIALMNWIEQIIPIAAIDLTQMNRVAYQHFQDVGWDFDVKAGGQGGFSPFYFDLSACWGIHYEKGNGLTMHNHFPYCLAFTYCIQADEDASPLVLEDHKIDTVEGRLVVFEGRTNHGVAASESERTVIAGNFLYHDKGLH